MTIAHLVDGFQLHVASTLNGPLVVLLEEDGADEPDDGIAAGEDADDFHPALDLAVEALDGVGAVELGAVLPRECHVGQHAAFGLIHDCGELQRLWTDLVGHGAPLDNAASCELPKFRQPHRIREGIVR